MTAHTSPIMRLAEPADLRPVQLAWLAVAVFFVSAGYGALLPLLPGWLTLMMPGATATEIARHVGFFGGVYAAGVLVGTQPAGRRADPGDGRADRACPAQLRRLDVPGRQPDRPWHRTGAAGDLLPGCCWSVRAGGRFFAPNPPAKELEVHAFCAEVRDMVCSLTVERNFLEK